MSKKIYHIFDSIKTDENFKNATLSYVLQHTDPAPKRNFVPRITAAVILFLCLFSLGSISYHMYITPVSYVDIDVNPSMELVVNRFGRVIDTYAYNEEAALLDAKVNIRHKTYAHAVTLLLNTMVQDGYLADESLISITVNTGLNQNDILETVDANIQTLLDRTAISAEKDIYPVDDVIKTHSHSLNLTPAKYMAILALQEVDAAISIEECKDHSIRELRDYTQNSHNNTSENHQNKNHHNNSHEK